MFSACNFTYIILKKNFIKYNFVFDNDYSRFHFRINGLGKPWGLFFVCKSKGHFATRAQSEICNMNT